MYGKRRYAPFYFIIALRVVSGDSRDTPREGRISRRNKTELQFTSPSTDKGFNPDEPGPTKTVGQSKRWIETMKDNTRPFPIFPQPLLRSESKSEIFVMVIYFNFNMIEK